MNSMWYIPVILCIYAVIPFLAMLKNRVNIKAAALPAAIAVFTSFLIPSYNSLSDLTSFRYAYLEESAVVCTSYLFYVIAGYWLSTGGLKKLGNVAAVAGFVLSFGGACAYQFFAYTREYDFHMEYNFILILFSACFLFELFRRIDGKIQKSAKLLRHISERAFGVFFVHILIMTVVYVLFGSLKSAMPQAVYCLFLVFVSLLGSAAVIEPLSLIPIVRRYIFMMK